MENKIHIMQNYLRRFQTTEDYEDFKESEDYIEPNVSICKDTGSVMYNQSESNNRILKFKSFSVSKIKLAVGGGSPAAISLQYSKDNGDTWMPYTIGETIDLGLLETVMLKGNNSSFSSGQNYYQFQMTGSVAASGDVTSLLNGVGGDVSLNDKDYCFFRLFYQCTALTQAPNLPSMTLAQYCYGQMFQGCTALKEAPELPATMVCVGAYMEMFKGCTALTKAPSVIPATEIQWFGCYQMFQGCTALTQAPELPATTIGEDGCYQMFQGCRSLTVAPSKLPATTLAEECYYGMFNGCTSLTTAPSKLPATTLANYCYSNMFQGCTALTTAPELPATTLVTNCYGNMFNGCTNLNYIKAMFTTTPGSLYTGRWVTGVASSGTFVKNSAAEWDVTGVSGVPSGWTVQTASE